MNNTKKFDINSIDLDADLDDLLNIDFSTDDTFESMDITKIDVEHNKNSYANNTLLLEEYSKTHNPIILQELLENNKPLVLDSVNYYKKSILNNTLLDDNDLIQAGMIGLHKAIIRFDIKKGTQFSTYAVWWINQSITREIMDNGNIVRIPVHVGQDLLKLKKIEGNYFREHGYIDIKSICDKMNIEESKYNNLKNIDYKFCKIKSIDAYCNQEDNDTAIIDILQSNNALDNLSEEFLDPCDLTIKHLDKKILLDLLDNFTEKEKNIILLRFGFIDDTTHTLEEIGSIYNVTRERIRQIESKVIRKLRHPYYKKKLKIVTDTSKSISSNTSKKSKNKSSKKRYKKFNNKKH